MRTTSSLITLGLLLVNQLPMGAATNSLPPTPQSVQSNLDACSHINKPVNIPANTSKAAQTTNFTPFTGKIIRNKVRMRLQPNLDSSILRELNRNDMVIVVGESDDFYVVKAPSDVKGYVFRTLILDDVVEGDKVNVRLEPDLAAPVIAQLNNGDRVKSTVSSLDKKWLEITPPANTYFHVCKDYVEKIGDPSLMITMEKRREEVTDLLNEAYLASQTELKKPYEQIHLDDVTDNLNKVINQYGDFPAQAGRAKEILASTQEAYLLKKIAYMEAKTSGQPVTPTVTNITVSGMPMSKTSTDEATMSSVITAPSASASLPTIKNNQAPVQAMPSFANASTFSMTRWASTEQQLFQQWQKDHVDGSLEDFYREQQDNSVALQGIIEPYNRSVKNKPGDYLLVNQANHLPIAYLYSSKVNLDAQIGHEVTINVAKRDNHNFAFPAYFVLSVD